MTLFVFQTLMNSSVAGQVVASGRVLMMACVAANLLRPVSYAGFVRAQAANDFIVFGTVAFTAFSSGAMLIAGGWAGVNGGIIVPVAAALALVLWHRARRVAMAVPG